MSRRRAGGTTVIDTEHGDPAGGVDATVKVCPPLGATGAVQVTVAPVVALSLPPVVVQTPTAGAVITTCSFTPTVVRVFAVPSGAAATVLVVNTHAGAAGGAGGAGGAAGAGGAGGAGGVVAPWLCGPDVFETTSTSSSDGAS